MSSMPEEIYRDILLRLPVESLLVCKCVCKNWYALISSPDFVKFHFGLSTHKDNNVILMFQSYDTKFIYTIDYDLSASSVCEIEGDAVEMDYPFESLGYDVVLVASCNGLVCIRAFTRRCNPVTEYLCLWNPATREYKEIPKSPIYEIDSVNMYVLFYDHKTDDYKLALGIETRLNMDSNIFQVYTLASDSWKIVKTIPYRFLSYSGVLVNGHLHWLVSAQNNFLHLSMDISDESFKELQLPKELLEKSGVPYMTSGVLDGCLCVLVESYINSVKIHVEVWVMLDCGVQESWARRYIITHEKITTTYRHSKLISSFENGKILFVTSGSLVLYDPEHGSAKELNIHNTFFWEIESYIESLVSLKSGTYIGEEMRIEERKEI